MVECLEMFFEGRRKMTMRDLIIRPRSALDRPRKRGDFDAYVNKDAKTMLFPGDLYDFIILECNARNAESAMNYLHNHPQTVARLLGWTDEEAKAAFLGLWAHVNAVLNMPESQTGGKK